MQHAARPAPRPSRRPLTLVLTAVLLSGGTTAWILKNWHPAPTTGQKISAPLSQPLAVPPVPAGPPSSPPATPSGHEGSPSEHGDSPQKTPPPSEPAPPLPLSNSVTPGEPAAGEFTRLLQEADAHLQKEDLPAARHALLQALRLYPDSPRGKAAMGRLEMEAHNYSEAQHWLKEAVAAEPDNANHNLWLCQARFRLHDKSGARLSCARALKLDPSLTDATLILRGMR
jgi:hypothetical protein